MVDAGVDIAVEDVCMASIEDIAFEEILDEEEISIIASLFEDVDIPSSLDGAVHPVMKALSIIAASAGLRIWEILREECIMKSGNESAVCRKIM